MSDRDPVPAESAVPPPPTLERPAQRGTYRCAGCGATFAIADIADPNAFRAVDDHLAGCEKLRTLGR